MEVIMDEETCQSISFHGIEVDRSRFRDKTYFVKKVYQILANPTRPFDNHPFHQRVELVAFLEKTLRTEFRNTSDMKHKLTDFLNGYDLRKADAKIRIRKTRKKQSLTQQQLAKKLGYSSHVPIAQMESGKRQASKRVLAWLEEEKM
jgi:DNA-binding XRE family transcriptional regulator